MVEVNPIVDRLKTYPAEALYAKRKELCAQGIEVFDFSVGDPIEPTDSLIVEGFRNSAPKISQYPEISGLPEFRIACADWVRRRFKVEIDPATEILPSSGSKEAIFHLPLTFLNPRGSRGNVLFGTPAYPVYERGTLFAGGEPWPVELRPESGYRLEPWNLPKERIVKTAIIWTNYPHNPTCATVDRGYLQQLAVFAEAHDILLCCDECYVDLYFDEPPLSMLQVARKGILTFHSLSKRSGMTGYRSGFIAGDSELIKVLRKTRANFGVATSTMVQKASIAAWQDDTHAQMRRELFKRKRDLFIKFFDEKGIEYEPCIATLYLWVRVPKEQEAVEYAEQLASNGILVSPAPFHGVEQPYVRLALVPSMEDCKKAIKVWKQL
ncbi:MAG: succinyldiaminopimelate transaminase [Pseudomonadota bacterium]